MNRLMQKRKTTYVIVFALLLTVFTAITLSWLMQPVEPNSGPYDYNNLRSEVAIFTGDPPLNHNSTNTTIWLDGELVAQGHYNWTGGKIAAAFPIQLNNSKHNLTVFEGTFNLTEYYSFRAKKGDSIYVWIMPEEFSIIITLTEGYHFN